MRAVLRLLAGLLLPPLLVSCGSAAAARAPDEDAQAAVAALQSAPGERTLELADLVDPGRLAQLVAPDATLPSWGALSPDDAQALAEWAADCTRAPAALQSPEAQKAAAWQAWRCQRTPLPEGFAARPPLVHPSGRSYAWLLWAEGAAGQGAPAPDLRRQMHVTERAALPEASPDERLLGGLSAPARAALAAGGALIVDGDWALLRAGGTLDALRYALYPRAALSAQADAVGLVARPGWQPDGCVSRVGGLCWQRAPTGRGVAPALALVGLLVTLALAAALLRGRVVRARQARAERARWEHTLRLLAHELRTPAAGLTLSVDALRDHYDALPPHAQDALLALLAQSRRLNRVLETSQKYLSASGAQVRVRPIDVAAFVAATVEGEGVAVELDLPPAGVALRFDPDWVALVLRNLLSNAVAHGQPPVRVSAQVEGRRLALSVSDAGGLGQEALPALSVPFARGDRSRGLGLGLDLAARAAELLGGTLTLSGPPTCFTLRLEEPA